MVILKYNKIICFQIKESNIVRKLLIDRLPLGEGGWGIDSTTLNYLT